jgi:undecaprenyl diphosphate synthase
MSKDSPNNKSYPLQHVAIIMDGNSRWAKQRGLGSLSGHEAGIERMRGILNTAKDHQINTVTLFAFSSENWHRPKLEVRGLMSLFASYLKRESQTLKDDRIRLRVIGSRDHFSNRLQRLIDDAEAMTANGVFNLNLCVDYGGHWDIVRTARQLASEVQCGNMAVPDISEQVFDEYMTERSISAPDLCIRTAGEQRLSNFMLWQMAYTELYFASCYWPDFDNRAFECAIAEYHRRQRRFGLREKDTLSSRNNPVKKQRFISHV